QLQRVLEVRARALDFAEVLVASAGAVEAAALAARIAVGAVQPRRVEEGLECFAATPLSLQIDRRRVHLPRIAHREHGRTSGLLSIWVEIHTEATARRREIRGTAPEHVSFRAQRG